jgi:DNA-binding IclR family transcriptional regulator
MSADSQCQGNSRNEANCGALSSSLRCLEVLEKLAQDPRPLSLSEIAKSMQVAKSTAHRFVTTLMAAGFVAQEGSTRRYHLAGKALWIGTGFLRYSPAYRAGYAALDRLEAHLADTMAHLGVWDSDSVLYLHTTGPLRSTLLFTDIGERRPVHCTALGKTLLAYRPARDVERIFARGLERYTDKTIVSIPVMREELARIRRCGYALDDEEGVRGLRCIASPIWDSSGEAVAALSISSPLAQLSDSEVLRCARLVQEAALWASVQLGYRTSTVNVASLLTVEGESGPESVLRFSRKTHPEGPDLGSKNIFSGGRTQKSS